MIQRIQSLYLLAESILLAILFFVPFNEFITKKSAHTIFNHQGVKMVTDGTILMQTLPLTVLIAVMVALALITIFLFKNRKLQIRFCVYNIVLSFGFLAMIAYYSFILKNNYDIEAIIYKPWLVLPLLTAFFSYQALRGIRKDDILVKSYDRLR